MATRALGMAWVKRMRASARAETITYRASRRHSVREVKVELRKLRKRRP